MDDFETMQKIMQFVPFTQRLHASCLMGKTYPRFTDEEKECVVRALDIVKTKSDEVTQRTLKKWESEKKEGTSEQQS